MKPNSAEMRVSKGETIIGPLKEKLSCANCYFLDVVGGDPVCRRNPPQANVVMVPKPGSKHVRDPRPVTAWPIVRAEDWCGHHASLKTPGSK